MIDYGRVVDQKTSLLGVSDKNSAIDGQLEGMVLFCLSSAVNANFLKKILRSNYISLTSAQTLTEGTHNLA